MESDIYSVLVSGPLFFTTRKPPKSLSQIISAPKQFRFEFKTGPKQASILGLTFSLNFCRFCDFLHTTSSASRIAPATSKPRFRLSSFLLFLLSLRPCFRRLFGSKWVPKRKRKPKRNPKPDLSKRDVPPNKKIPCSKKGSEMGAEKGGQCGLLASSMLCCCFLLDFRAFRPYFGP